MPEPETQEYELTDGLERVVRPTLVLEAGETAELTEGEYERYEEILEPVDGSSETTDDEEN